MSPLDAAEKAVFVTVALASLQVALIFLLKRPIVSPATAYWFGWIAVLSLTYVTELCNWLPYHFSARALSVIERMHIGALLGFTLASLVNTRSRYALHEARSLSQDVTRIHSYLSTRLLLSLFGIGLVLFAERVARGGLDLTGLRQLYNERSGSFLGWIGSHLTVLCGVLIGSEAVYDARATFNLKKLVLFVLASAPLSLAYGGRIFLLAFPLHYFASFLLLRSWSRRGVKLLSWRELGHAGLLLIVLLLIFAIMGFTRGGYGHRLNVVRTIVVWPVSSVAALDSWSQQAGAERPTYGTLLFDTPLRWLERLGVLRNSRSGAERMDQIVAYFRSKTMTAAVIPPTIAPTLIIDFGESGILASSMALAFAIELAAGLLAVRGWIQHRVASQLVVASFMTIQFNPFQSAFFAALAWIVAIGLLIRSPLAQDASETE